MRQAHNAVQTSYRLSYNDLSLIASSLSDNVHYQDYFHAREKPCNQARGDLSSASTERVKCYQSDVVNLELWETRRELQGLARAVEDLKVEMNDFRCEIDGFGIGME